MDEALDFGGGRQPQTLLQKAFRRLNEEDGFGLVHARLTRWPQMWLSVYLTMWSTTEEYKQLIGVFHKDAFLPTDFSANAEPPSEQIRAEHWDHVRMAPSDFWREAGEVYRYLVPLTGDDGHADLATVIREPTSAGGFAFAYRVLEHWEPVPLGLGVVGGPDVPRWNCYVDIDAETFGQRADLLGFDFEEVDRSFELARHPLREQAHGFTEKEPWFRALDPSAKAVLRSAEQLWLQTEAEGQGPLDLSLLVVCYCKAVEIEFGDKVFRPHRVRILELIEELERTPGWSRRAWVTRLSDARKGLEKADLTFRAGTFGDTVFRLGAGDDLPEGMHGFLPDDARGRLGKAGSIRQAVRLVFAHRNDYAHAGILRSDEPADWAYALSVEARAREVLALFAAIGPSAASAAHRP